MDLSSGIDFMTVTIPALKAKKIQNTGRILNPIISRYPKKLRKGGLHGYTVSTEYSCGALELQNPDYPKLGVHYIYSGSTLRNMGMEAWDLLWFHSSMGHAITRLDIRVDLMDSGLKIRDLRDDVESGKAITNSKAFTFIEAVGGKAESLYVGSMKKRKKLLRVYNKGVEQGHDDMDWQRIELELHRPSSGLAANMLLDDIDNEKSTIQAIINGFCSFPENEVWHKAMLTEPISIRVPEIAKETETRKWLLNVCSKALAREVDKDPDFLFEFIKRMNEERLT